MSRDKTIERLETVRILLRRVPLKPETVNFIRALRDEQERLLRWISVVKD